MKKSIILASAVTLLTAHFAFADAPKKDAGGGRGRAALDKNGDGKITRDELRAQADAHFDRMDTNKDGVVDDKDERRHGGPRGEGRCGSEEDHDGEHGEGRGDHPGRGMHRGGMKHLLDRADANKDGKLSASEAEAFGKARFADMDANKDGFLTQDELRPKKHESRDKK